MTSRNTSGNKRVFMILYGPLRIDSRVLREAKTLAGHGKQVTILSVDMGFEEWTDYYNVTESRVLYAPFRERTRIVTVLRFWLRSFKKLLSARGKIDVLHAHDLTGLVPAFFFALLHPGVKLIYDSHELFPEAALDKISLLHYIVFLGFELVCSKRVNRLIAVSPSNARTLSKRIHAPITLLLNVPDLERIKTSDGTVPKWDDSRRHETVKIAYSGNVLPYRGYETLPDIAEILAKALDLHFEFWIIGAGPYLNQLETTVRRRRLDKYFKFTGRVSYEKLLKLTTECDLAIGLYEGTRNNNSSLSNKLLEYMCIGIPFIFTNITQSLPIINRVGALVVSTPVLAKDVADAILGLLENKSLMIEIGRKGYHLVRTRFNWRVESQRLVSLYSSL